MKRLLVIFLSFALLLACAPTPEEAFVVNKGDGTFEELIRVTAAPERVEPAAENTAPEAEKTPKPEGFDAPIVKPAESTEVPAHWDGRIETQFFTIRIDADIRSNGHPCPVRKVCRHTFTVPELSKLASAMLPQVDAVWNSDMPSRQEYEAAIASLSGRSMEDKAKDTYLEMQSIADLPDEQFSPTAEIGGAGESMRQTYHCANGRYAAVSGFSDSILINASRHATIHGEEMLKIEGHYIDEGPVFLTVGMSQEQAEDVLYAFLSSVGLNGYSVCAAEKASYYDTIALEEIDRGWYFRLVNANEYAAVETQRNGIGGGLFRYDEQAQYSAPWPNETMLVFVGEQGVQHFAWTNPLEVTEIVNPDVQLLSFVEMQSRMQNFLRIGISYMTKQYAAEGKLSKVVLGQLLVPVKDEPGRAYLIPAWICEIEMYDIFSGGYSYSEFVCFNAVDGSPISQ